MIKRHYSDSTCMAHTITSDLLVSQQRAIFWVGHIACQYFTPTRSVHISPFTYKPLKDVVRNREEIVQITKSLPRIYLTIRKTSLSLLEIVEAFNEEYQLVGVRVSGGVPCSSLVPDRNQGNGRCACRLNRELTRCIIGFIRSRYLNSRLCLGISQEYLEGAQSISVPKRNQVHEVAMHVIIHPTRWYKDEWPMSVFVI